jgi:hypothetical protein
MDLGAPVSWMLITPGSPVFSRDGRDVGAVRHVLADARDDIFEGLVLALAGGRHAFADAEEIAEMRERGVVLARDAAGCDELPEPRPAPASLEAHGDEPPPGPLERRLHRAWELLSGEG